MKRGKHGTPAEVIAKVRAVLNPTPEVIALRAANTRLRAALEAIMNGQIGGNPDMDAERFRNARAVLEASK